MLQYKKQHFLTSESVKCFSNTKPYEYMDAPSPRAICSIWHAAVIKSLYIILIKGCPLRYQNIHPPLSQLKVASPSTYKLFEISKVEQLGWVWQRRLFPWSPKCGFRVSYTPFSSMELQAWSQIGSERQIHTTSLKQSVSWNRTLTLVKWINQKLS